MEIKNIVYLPVWVRAVALLILGLGFASGLFFVYYSITSVKGGNPEYVKTALSVAQFSAYGLAIALVVLFAERELSINRLLSRMDTFLEKLLPAGLRRIRIPSLGQINGEPIEVETNHARGKPRAFYTLRYQGYAMLVQVDANIKQLNVMYHFPVVAEADLEPLTAKFETTIVGAKQVGWEFNSYIMQEAFDNRFYLELFFRMQIEENFLLNSPEMLFWITDIAVMSRSALMKGMQAGLLPHHQK